MSIYFRSSLGIAFPKSPYIGQVYYDPDLKRTFRYQEREFSDTIFGCIDMFKWVDITEKDIAHIWSGKSLTKIFLWLRY